MIYGIDQGFCVNGFRNSTFSNNKKFPCKSNHTPLMLFSVFDTILLKSGGENRERYY